MLESGPVVNEEVTMARKRQPHNDWICLRCGCPCDQAGSRHLGGGQGMRSCKKSPVPMLRSALEAETQEILAGLALNRNIYPRD